MIPYSLSSSNSNSTYYSTMPLIDLNIVDDQSHELIFSPTHQPSSSSSSLSSCPTLFNPSQHYDHQQDHARSSLWESKNGQNDHDEACGKNFIASRGSWNYPRPEEKGGDVEIIRKRGLKLKVWKRSSVSSKSSEREEDDENHNQNHNHNQTMDNNDSVMKWMPSKMRMMRKMMVASSDHSHTNKAFSEDQNLKQGRPVLLSPRGTDHNSSSSNNSSTHSNSNSHSNNITVRVCSDCHTTKTPLWRSGPRGPKSLCNACGIRQRKARRAMAAAAANGGSPVVAEKSLVKGTTYKVHSNKEKKLKLECESHHHMKKKKHMLEDDHHHHGKKANDDSINNNNSRGRSSSSSIINKLSFEDFTVSLMSKNLAAASQVFPQDEKEAAILLMALSCNGLVHG